jgi:ankyrin repeat protein
LVAATPEIQRAALVNGTVDGVPIARAFNREVAEILLSAGADVNKEDCGQSPWPRCTAVQNAARLGDAELLKLLLEAGGDLHNGPGKGQKSPLCLAARARSACCVRLLLDAGMDPNVEVDDELPLHAASEGGVLDVMEILLAAGAKVNAEAGCFRRTPLSCAVSNGQLCATEMLLRAGADPNAGRRPVLDDAARFNKVAIARALIDAGADVKRGHPLSAARTESAGHEMVELLLLRADADPRDLDGRDLSDWPDDLRQLLERAIAGRSWGSRPKLCWLI